MHLKTNRLLISLLDLDDAPFILELLNTPAWLKFIGDRGIRNLEDARNYLLSGPLESYQKHGFGLYLLREKSSSQKVGICGFLKREKLEYPDLGFALMPEFYGQGIGTEAAIAILNFGFDQLRLKKVLAITDIDNYGSIRLLEKIGMQREGVYQFPESEEELLLFSINPI